MYARYVPPPKTSPAAPAPLPAAGPRAQDAPPADGFGYARYVPPTHPPTSPPPRGKRGAPDAGEQSGKRAKTRGGPPRATAAADQHAGEAAPAQRQPPAKPSKNRRKRKQRTRADSSSSPSSSSSSSSSAASEDEPPRRAPLAARHDGNPKPVPAARQGADGDQDQKTHVNPPNRESETAVVASEAQTVDGNKGKKRNRDKRKKSDEAETARTSPGPEPEQPRHRAVLERKEKSLKLATRAARDVVAPGPDEQPVEAHGLEPLPQPAVAADDESTPTYDTLPPWLARPTRVPQQTRRPFAELGVSPRAARFLAQRGFADALAVQAAVVPLLLPDGARRPGDVLIAAATGSGKTLAYALPVVRDLAQGLVTRLRALVVLPTRELVGQVRDVFELCARAYDGEGGKRVHVGVAAGHQTLAAEQRSLTASESRYDPEAYRALRGRLARLPSGRGRPPPAEAAPGDVGGDVGPGAWDGEVVESSCRVDVLICTPGRLVEHVDKTPGFGLDYVRWLVVDEADKLLAQSFQGWLERVLDRCRGGRFGARDFPDAPCSGIRKVVLSATLTRDPGLLARLDLRRPRLVVLDGDGDGAAADAPVAEHALPPSLREFAVRVHATSLKPLYLLDLLRSRAMAAASDGAAPPRAGEATPDSSDAGSGSDSAPSEPPRGSDGGGSGGEAGAPRSRLPRSLIFTKSNESALRLARLLQLLEPSLSAHLATVTSDTPTHKRRKTLRAFATASSPVHLIVASDLVARGIDIPGLGHVINYDLPASVAGYVHRVGRTARAGRGGCAWTLVGDDESGWFWGRIAKGQAVRRAQAVERTRIDEMGEERVKLYEESLASLAREALEMRRR